MINWYVLLFIIGSVAEDLSGEAENLDGSASGAPSGDDSGSGMRVEDVDWKECMYTKHSACASISSYFLCHMFCTIKKEIALQGTVLQSLRNLQALVTL